MRGCPSHSSTIVVALSMTSPAALANGDPLGMITIAVVAPLLPAALFGLLSGWLNWRNAFSVPCAFLLFLLLIALIGTVLAGALPNIEGLAFLGSFAFIPFVLICTGAYAVGNSMRKRQTGSG